MRLLVTGGSGTFGRAFIRRALSHTRWRAVASYSRDEQKAAALVEEFGSCPPFKAFLGDVRDSTRLGMALRGVDVVVHAAALKRVDVGAYSPSELIATNIMGTMNVVNAAIHAGVGRVVVLSSDKACEPTNLYGMTKGCAESYAVQANAFGYPSGTRICAVRYGNILGSRGSVFHIWRAQMERGQPITITDARMTRFMMTIEEAVQLVDFAIEHMQGGEIFVPSLPVATMVQFAKAVVPDNYPMEFTTIRPGGEKFAETLINGEEMTRARMVTSKTAAILPTHHDWTNVPPWHDAPLPPYVDAYRSDSVHGTQLDRAALRAMIARTEACQ